MTLDAFGYTTMPKLKCRPKSAQAIRTQREFLRLTQEELAENAGDLLSQGTITDLETGRNPLERMEIRRVAALARALKWTLPELQTATGVDFAAPQIFQSSHATQGRWANVLDMASASRPDGHAAPVDATQHFIEHEHDRGGAVPFTVRGDSMQPTIFDGDIVYCDTHDVNYQDGKIYVFNLIGDGMCVKRARHTSKGWMLTSDNATHGAFSSDEVEIFGRVYFIVPKGIRV